MKCHILSNCISPISPETEGWPQSKATFEPLRAWHEAVNARLIAVSALGAHHQNKIISTWLAAIMPLGTNKSVFCNLITVTIFTIHEIPIFQLYVLILPFFPRFDPRHQCCGQRSAAIKQLLHSCGITRFKRCFIGIQYVCLIIYRSASNWWSIQRCLYISW